MVYDIRCFLGKVRVFLLEEVLPTHAFRLKEDEQEQHSVKNELKDEYHNPTNTLEGHRGIADCQDVQKPLDKIDSFLIHRFSSKILRKELDSQEGVTPSTPFLLPMMVQVSNPQWKPKEVPDCYEYYRTKQIVGCYGSIESVKVLDRDPEVVYVESGG
jgi:hypothetical protein